MTSIPMNGSVQDRTRQDVPAAAADGRPTDRPKPVEEVLRWGRRSKRARTVNLATRLADLVEQLRARVEAEAAQERDQQAAKAAEAAAQAEVEQLQAKLADARSRARKARRTRTTAPGSSSPAGDHDPKAVRAWAKYNGYECAAKGRVPAQVVQAWRAANPQQGNDGGGSVR